MLLRIEPQTSINSSTHLEIPCIHELPRPDVRKTFLSYLRKQISFNGISMCCVKKKEEKISWECRADSPDLVASLNALSSFYDENSAHARRMLRSTIEKRALQINNEFLSAADSTQIALDRVGEEVNALADCCDKIAAALSSSAATTSNIISTTERLKQELDVITQREEIVNCFLRDY